MSIGSETDVRPVAGRCSGTSMDNAIQKIKYGPDIASFSAQRNSA
jgi:hypothetical protein